MEDELIQDAVRSGARLAKRTANESAGRKVASARRARHRMSMLKIQW